MGVAIPAMPPTRCYVIRKDEYLTFFNGEKNAIFWVLVMNGVVATYAQ